MSQSRELSTDIHSAFALVAQEGARRAHLPDHRRLSLGDLGEEIGHCIIKTGHTEDPVLVAWRRGSEKLLSWTSLQEKGGWGGGEGRSALETEKQTQREMDRDMKRDRQ